MVDKDILTENEKHSIKVLNFILSYDGIIQSENEIIYLLEQGIEKFIAKKRRHLVSVAETAYPIKIRIGKSKKFNKK